MKYKYNMLTPKSQNVYKSRHISVVIQQPFRKLLFFTLQHENTFRKLLFFTLEHENTFSKLLFFTVQHENTFRKLLFFTLRHQKLCSKRMGYTGTHFQAVFSMCNYLAINWFFRFLNPDVIKKKNLDKRSENL